MRPDKAALAAHFMKYAFAATFFVVPLFPSFITLTGVTVPGVSLLPRPVTIALLLFIGALALITLALMLIVPGQSSPTLVPLLCWLGSAILSAALGFDPSAGLLFIGVFAASVLWHLALLRFYREPGVSDAIFTSFLLSGALASLAAIAMVLIRIPAAQYTVGHGRAIGTYILPGELAGYLIIYIPTAFSVYVVTRWPFLRRMALFGVTCGSIALVMTYSRAGWMGLISAVAFFIFFARQRARRRYALAALLLGVALVIFTLNAHHNPSENYTRLSIWQAGIRIVERFPLTGVGPFVFAKIYPLVRTPDGERSAYHAHSFLLTIFAETGVLGVCAVLFSWWRFIVVLNERLRRNAGANRLLALGVAAGLLGTWVQGLIDTVSVVIFGLWLPFMAMALNLAEDGLMEHGG